MFGAACGRLFEGTPSQLKTSLERLKKLPPSTHCYCAHEYTLANLNFALAVEPLNVEIRKRLEATQAARERGDATVYFFGGTHRRSGKRQVSGLGERQLILRKYIQQFANGKITFGWLLAQVQVNKSVKIGIVDDRLYVNLYTLKILTPKRSCSSMKR
ncbi:MAG: hypothetical protein JNM39_04410 [Bdellovibrionaceae bacterium]|nr:hypothetical protein [Pseudobdellovibrionaceae bacterium]